MGRPRSISTRVANVAVKVMERLERAMELDENHIPTEAQAKVVVLFAKAQAILRSDKPPADDEDDERPEDQVVAGIKSLEEETQHLKGGRA